MHKTRDGVEITDEAYPPVYARVIAIPAWLGRWIVLGTLVVIGLVAWAACEAMRVRRAIEARAIKDVAERATYDGGLNDRRKERIGGVSDDAEIREPGDGDRPLPGTSGGTR